MEALKLFCGCCTALGRLYGLQVSQTGEGTLQGVASAIVRGRQIRCVTFWFQGNRGMPVPCWKCQAEVSRTSCLPCTFIADQRRAVTECNSIVKAGIVPMHSIWLRLVEFSS